MHDTPQPVPINALTGRSGRVDPGPGPPDADDAAPSAEPVRVLIVDEREIVREGLRAVFARRPGLILVGEASTAASALQETLRLRPDVVLIDVASGEAGAFDACRAISNGAQSARVIMLIPNAEEHTVMGAIFAGASGIVPERIAASALLEAVASVAHGESLLDPTVTSHVLCALRSASGQRHEMESLSAQEWRVLAEIGQGKTNKEIAAAVGLSEKTVKNHVSSILSKLRMHRRSEAAAFAARHTPEGASHG